MRERQTVPWLPTWFHNHNSAKSVNVFQICCTRSRERERERDENRVKWETRRYVTTVVKPLLIECLSLPPSPTLSLSLSISPSLSHSLSHSLCPGCRASSAAVFRRTWCTPVTVTRTARSTRSHATVASTAACRSVSRLACLRKVSYEG